jgi:uncharacterized membrane protein
MTFLYSLLVFALGTAFGMRFLRQCPVLPPEEARRAAPRRLLEESYARGEMSTEEFEERRRALSES